MKTKLYSTFIRVLYISGSGGNLGPGHLEVRINLEDLDISKPDSFESWVRAFERKRLRTYTAILREEETLLNKLTNTLNLPGVEFKKITLGSMTLHAHFEDVDAFNSFKEHHRTGKLTNELNEVLISDSLLQEVGVDAIGVSAYLQTTDIRRCHHELSTRRSARRRSAPIDIQEGIHTTRVYFSLRYICLAFKVGI